jgi:hypothetical protein
MEVEISMNICRLGCRLGYLAKALLDSDIKTGARV